MNTTANASSNPAELLKMAEEMVQAIEANPELLLGSDGESLMELLGRIRALTGPTPQLDALVARINKVRPELMPQNPGFILAWRKSREALAQLGAPAEPEENQPGEKPRLGDPSQ